MSLSDRQLSNDSAYCNAQLWNKEFLEFNEQFASLFSSILEWQRLNDCGSRPTSKRFAARIETLPIFRCIRDLKKKIVTKRERSTLLSSKYLLTSKRTLPLGSSHFSYFDAYPPKYWLKNHFSLELCLWLSFHLAENLKSLRLWHSFRIPLTFSLTL